MVQRSPFLTQSVAVSRSRRSFVRVMITSPMLASFPSVHSAYFFWMIVLAVSLWRRPTIKERDGDDLEKRTRASALQAPGS
jgi:hypothetical protein